MEERNGEGRRKRRKKKRSREPTDWIENGGGADRIEKGGADRPWSNLFSSHPFPHCADRPEREAMAETLFDDIIESRLRMAKIIYLIVEFGLKFSVPFPFPTPSGEL